SAPTFGSDQQITIARGRPLQASGLWPLGGGRDTPVVAVNVFEQMLDGVHVFLLPIESIQSQAQKGNADQLRLRPTRKRKSRIHGLVLSRRFWLLVADPIFQSLR
ncbi:hypothetical protein, partial [Mesorhizobium sp. M8A.F.Ca.ET.021.01.1.1]|uniref:hypothetical protein n=1 Tax=Mesorhizobium sp. M8A.F.Ca.ET.021.01.1.1 TaxID=2496757 RepID=UPI001AECAEFB